MAISRGIASLPCPMMNVTALPTTSKTIEIVAYSVPCGFWVGIVVRGLPLLRVG